MNSVNTDNNTTTATQLPKPTTSLPSSTPSVVTTSPAVNKEQEVPTLVSTETIQAISHEIEIPKEVEKVGVRKIGDTIELPPDVKRLGVTPTGPSTTLATTTTSPQVVLPLSDQNVLVGLHTKVTSALRWLAIWCVRKLKKAHIALKVIHGKIMRVRIQ